MKKEKIQAYIDPVTKKAIEQKAKAEKRSVSNTAGLILDEALANDPAHIQFFGHELKSK